MEFVGCETGRQAKGTLAPGGSVNLVTTALRLPDMDGLALAEPRARRRAAGLHADHRGVRRRAGAARAAQLTDYVTDYFDKSLGFDALATFIRGYVRRRTVPGGDVLYVEDSRVVAVATRRMLEKHGLTITHCT